MLWDITVLHPIGFLCAQSRIDTALSFCEGPILRQHEHVLLFGMATLRWQVQCVICCHGGQGFWSVPPHSSCHCGDDFANLLHLQRQWHVSSYCHISLIGEFQCQPFMGSFAPQFCRDKFLP